MPRTPSRRPKRPATAAPARRVEKAGRVSTKRPFVDYTEFKRIVQPFAIRTHAELRRYRTYLASLGVPASPWKTYRDQWEGWAKAFGVEERFVDYSTFTRIVRPFAIRTRKEFRRRRAEMAPLGIPAEPWKVYRGEWEGVAAAFGIKSPLVDYGTFKQIMLSRGVRSSTQFHRRRAELALLGIPSAPARTYRGEWGGWTVALGGDPRNGKGRQRAFATCEEAKAYAMKSGLRSQTEWNRAVKERRIPLNFPASPSEFYKGKGWKGHADFWGREGLVLGSAPERALRGGLSLGWPLSPNRKIRVPGRPRPWDVDVALVLADGTQLVLEYDGAHYHEGLEERDREKTRSLTAAGWPVVRIREAPLEALDPVMDLVVQRELDGVTLARQLSAHVARIAGEPDRLADVDDSVIRAHQAAIFDSPDERFLPMGQAMVVAQSLGIKTSTSYYQLSRAGSLSVGMPPTPSKVYAASWKGWGHFLGTGSVASHDKTFLPFEQARASARGLGLGGQREWHALSKAKGLPPGLPSSPWEIYRDQGWAGMPDWLGYAPGTPRRRYEAARAAKSLGLS